MIKLSPAKKLLPISTYRWATQSFSLVISINEQRRKNVKAITVFAGIVLVVMVFAFGWWLWEQRNDSLKVIGDRIAASLFTILKICIFALLLLAILFVIIKIYTPQGIVILPFEISKNEKLSGISIADQLTVELMRIQQIHSIKNENVILQINSSLTGEAEISTELSLGSREIIVPKKENMEFSMENTGTIGMGSNSLDPGKLIIAFKNICPFRKPDTTIRGSLQRYGSTIVLAALLEGGNVHSWIVRQPVDKNNEEQLHEMIRNLTYMIVHDLPQSNVSAKTWKGLMYYTEALDAYHQYELSRKLDDLSLAGNYSLKAISSEKGYKKPFGLLSSLESICVNIGRQNKATEYCDKTIDLDPTSVDGWNNKGGILLFQGKYDEAIKAFDEAIRLNSTFAGSWDGKGGALDMQGKYDEAIKAYDEAIRLNPNFTDAWNGKGWSLNRQGKYNIRLNPNYADAWNGKGVILRSQGKYDEAIKAYDEAIILNPDFAYAAKRSL